MIDLLFFVGGAAYAALIISLGAWAERVRRRRELNDRRRAAELRLPMQDVNGTVDEMKWYPEGSYYKSPYNNGK